MTPRLLACLFALSSAGAAAMAQPAPLTQIPRAAALKLPGEWASLLSGALDDYERLLPGARVMPGESLDAQGVRTTWHWSERVARFEARCQAEPEACQDVLPPQVRAMDRGLRDAGDGARDVMGAATLSALSDFCALGAQNKAFASCQLSGRAHEAAALWAWLGHEPQQVHYQRRYEWQRQQHLAWLASRGEPPSPSTLAALPELPWWVKARGMESQGSLEAARMTWQVMALQAAGQAQAPFPQLAALQVARLSWRLKDTERALAWSALVEAQGPLASCAERQEGLRVEIARRRVQGGGVEDLLQAMDRLMTDACPHTQALQELATDRFQSSQLAAEERAALLALINRALASCDQSGGCHALRLARLRDLALLAARDASGLAALAVRTQDALRQPSMLEAEQQLAWAVTVTLSQTPSLEGQGWDTGLLLQQHRLIAAQADLDATVAAQAEHSRFEELHRTMATFAARQGRDLSFGQVEGMRAQTLLRRLRVESLARLLEGVRDEEAEQAHARQQQDAATCLAEVSAVPAGLEGGWRPVMLRQAQSLCEWMRDAAGQVKLQALARRQAHGGDPHKAWVASLGGLDALGQLERLRPDADFSGETASLRPDEAYLSWLRVPGGYVAMLAEPQWDEILQVAMPHKVRSHFIPLTPGQEHTLSLYRELLMSGAGGTTGIRGIRGARVARPRADGGEGLSIQGLPLWRLPDGTHVAQAKAPAGAVRVKSVREVGHALHDMLLRPLSATGPHTRRLTISPDGPLAFLPFETLWDGERLLIDGVDVAYVQSLAVHKALARRAAQPARRPVPLLSVAHPDYSVQGQGEGGASLPAWMAALRWGALPGTARESDALVQGLAGARTLRGREASRERLLRMDEQGLLIGVQVMHFATHGLADPERSALVLSTHQGLREAYLQDADITRLRLSSDLVVLSACDTGLGRQQSGEGVMGLPYAFMLAGNTNTVMSLWPVDDEGAALFIPEFMRHAREGMDLVQALNATKRAFASGQRGERLQDPRIWAAFVQYGIPLKLAPAKGVPDGQR